MQYDNGKRALRYYNITFFDIPKDSFFRPVFFFISVLGVIFFPAQQRKRWGNQLFTLLFSPICYNIA